jgi:hypothetical protein
LASPIAAVASIFTNIFGRKETSTKKIGTNEFNCDLFEVTTKKCVSIKYCCKKCSLVGVEQKIDTECMKRVEAVLHEAQRIEELANWKEDVMEINMLENLGYQYVQEEVSVKGNQTEVLSMDNIELEEINHFFPNSENFTSRQEEENYKNKYLFDDDFDPNNQTFISDFEDSFTTLFPPLNNTDDELDLSQVYNNTQDLRVQNFLSLNTSRLSSSFKGIDVDKVNLAIPIDIDFNDGDRIKEQFEDFYDTLTDEKQTLMKAIVGGNVGITETLRDAFGMTPPVISIKKVKLNFNLILTMSLEKILSNIFNYIFTYCPRR